MEEDTFFDEAARAPSTVLCCVCGTVMAANAANMCTECIRNQVDITTDIPKQLTLQFCRTCGRYLQPPKYWMACELESRELLQICLKKIKGINRTFKLIDAGFIWTEPHSRRIKVRLVIQKEVLSSVQVQQSLVVEFFVQQQMCNKCQRSETSHTWMAVVQLRQKVDHKRTFLFLEQAILKSKANSNCLNVKDVPDGLDFFFSEKGHATKFVDFISTVVSVKVRTSQQLISADAKNNTATYKHAVYAELIPICKDDVVFLPPKVMKQLGNFGPFIVCTRALSSLHFVDPSTLVVREMTGSTYSSLGGFTSLCSSRQLSEFIVLDVEPTNVRYGKLLLADITVARSTDLGTNDTVFVTRSHLGNILHAGDTVLGYDLQNLNVNDTEFLEYSERCQIPDVILVKKVFPKQFGRRIWKLRRLDIERGESRKEKHIEKENQVFEEFMDAVEEDPEMRHHMNLFVDKDALALGFGQKLQLAPEDPSVRLEELLNEMELTDREEDDDGDDVGSDSDEGMD